MTVTIPIASSTAITIATAVAAIVGVGLYLFIGRVYGWCVVMSSATGDKEEFFFPPHAQWFFDLFHHEEKFLGIMMIVWPIKLTFDLLVLAALRARNYFLLFVHLFDRLTNAVAARVLRSENGEQGEDPCEKW